MNLPSPGCASLCPSEGEERRGQIAGPGIRARWQAFLALAACLAVVSAVRGQPFTPHVGYVYPGGGRQGATFEVVVGGQYLGSVSNAYVTGAGVQARVVEYNRPLNQKQFGELRDKLRELQDKRLAARQSPSSTNVWTAADDKTLTEIRDRILKNPPNRQGNPALAEAVTVEITLGPDAEAGEREIRLGTPNGLSNPLIFCVGQLPEVAKPAAKSPNPDLDRFLARLGRKPASSSAKSETRVTLPTVVNGQIMPGAVDRYRFGARKGQRLVVAAHARGLIPYLSDAVPGWFQATLALYDAKGKELAYDDDYRFNPDPVLFYEIPSDGEYVVAIKDSIYRGREDFVYRITLGELPFVTTIFPLGGQAGTQTPVALAGWNLPVTRLTQDNSERGPGVYPLFMRKEELISNRVPFAVDMLPEGLEQEPNGAQANAQLVTLPVILNGRIDRPGDWDVFRIDGRAGAGLVAEVYARRLASPLDSVLKLTDATGRQLAFNDDHEDKGAGLDTHYADSYLRATLPANGTYYLHLGDAQHQGGPEYAYRLRISPPRPDFELRVVPSSVTVRGGMAVPFTVFALRKDGFADEIAVVLKDAPRGFTLSGGRVPAGHDQVRLTLSAPPMPEPAPLRVSLEGRALIHGQAVFHLAVPADDMMQAFMYRHLVPAKELQVAVSGRGASRSALRILGETPVRIPAGGTARVRIGASSSAFADRVQLELSEPPEGIAIRNVSPVSEGAEIELQADAAKVKPGLRGNLIVSVFTGRPPALAQPGKAPVNRRRTPVGSLPAIPFEIVEP